MHRARQNTAYVCINTVHMSRRWHLKQGLTGLLTATDVRMYLGKSLEDAGGKLQTAGTNRHGQTSASVFMALIRRIAAAVACWLEIPPCSGKERAGFTGVKRPVHAHWLGFTMEPGGGDHSSVM
jgi:hypothetical protein